jgi:acetylornithine deacetylase/succinyl-diaminopimelate desuccinylase
MWVEAAFDGRPAHGSTPELGVNAIHHAAAFVAAVEDRLRPRLDRRTHDLLGRATINAGRIAGGDRPPMVAARCAVQYDRRWLPGETHEGVLDELRELLRDLANDIPDLRWTLRELEGTSDFVHHPLDCPPDAPGLAELEAAIAAVGGPAERFGAQFWSDAALLAHAGTPAVVCGPGDIAQAHSHDEYVEGEQLRRASRVYLLAAAGFLAAAAGPRDPATRRLSLDPPPR